MTETKLKSCPFCGGKDVKCIEYYGLYHVVCFDCHTAGRDCPSIETACEAWNSRPVEDSQAAEIKCLREVLEKAKYYLKKVDRYILPIADEADYFTKVMIDKILKEREE